MQQNYTQNLGKGAPKPLPNEDGTPPPYIPPYTLPPQPHLHFKNAAGMTDCH